MKKETGSIIVKVTTTNASFTKEFSKLKDQKKIISFLKSLKKDYLKRGSEASLKIDIITN